MTEIKLLDLNNSQELVEDLSLPESKLVWGGYPDEGDTSGGSSGGGETGGSTEWICVEADGSSEPCSPEKNEENNEKVKDAPWNQD